LPIPFWKEGRGRELKNEWLYAIILLDKIIMEDGWMDAIVRVNMRNV